MPIYEEKLISPLALRFTQEHIRTTFRDGCIVEGSIEEIEAQPSANDEFDVVLQAPFPQIEIIRWGRSNEDEQTSHWFTLDNRRLYCLQRAALKLWPKRVAAKVEILYADPGAVRKKYDSTTCGESVTMSDSCKDAPLFRFDWHVEAESLDVAKADFRAQGALEAIARDDTRYNVDDLPDVTEAEPDSILARALAFERALAAAASESDCLVRKGDAAMRCPTPSTSATSNDSDSTPRHATRRAAGSQGHHGDRRVDVQTQLAIQEINAQLRAPGADGRLRIRNWNERFGQHLGSLRKFIEARPSVYVLELEGLGKFKVREAAHNDVDANEDSTDSTASMGSVEAKVQQAVSEIRVRLQAQGGMGHVQIEDWNGRFSAGLGPFKTFVRSRPQDFSVVPGQGRLFRVALA